MLEQAKKEGSSIDNACLTLGVSVRTFERWRKDPSGDHRKGPLTIPANKLNDLERQQVLNACNSSEYKDKSCSQIVPSLADKGIYIASESSFYRILKQLKLNTHRGRSKPASRTRPKEIIATGPNQVWSWDITYLKTDVAGVFLYLYMVMDIYSRKIVGFEVHETQTSDHAANMIEKICKMENITRNQITLHSDNGKPMKGATMLARLQLLGVMPSFSRPSVSDDNPYSESLFKTIKYCPMYPSKPFDSIEEAIAWVIMFIKWYNEEHLHSGIRFVTPSSRHNKQDKCILENRINVYKIAYLKNPNRWTGSTRNWGEIKEVFLNCLHKTTRPCKKMAA
jgi:putative transposase